MLDILEVEATKSELDVVAEEAVTPSQTALVLDDWALRKGRDVLAESEMMQKVFDFKDDPKKLRGESRKRFNDLSLQTADFHAAAFEPEHELAKRCENPRLHQYMQNLMQTPEFKALHSETCLDEAASEFAAAAFAKGWVTLCQQEEAEGIKGEMQSLRAVGNALKEAASEVQNLRDMQAALGADGLKSIFKRVKGSESLRRIVELAGRYRRFAQAKQRTKVLHGRDDVVGVMLDGDVGRLLSHELALLDDPDLELDLMRRIVERQAMCREYQGVETKARGPIVVVVDESGSMSGEPIYTAKAMALALAWVAKSQNRFYCLVGFAGGTEGTYCVAPPNGIPRFRDYADGACEAACWMHGEEALMTWLEHFYSGGTTCDVPLVELPRHWEMLGCPRGKTDIICITDAIVSVPGEVQQSFLAWKLEQQVKMISLIINSEPGDLARVSDQVHRVRSLSLDEAGVGEAMSV